MPLVRWLTSRTRHNFSNRLRPTPSKMACTRQSARSKSVQRRVVEGLGDVKDEAAYRVKRQPFKALGIAVGVGLVLGVAVGWIGARFGKAKLTCDD